MALATGEHDLAGSATTKNERIAAAAGNARHPSAAEPAPARGGRAGSPGREGGSRGKRGLLRRLSPLLVAGALALAAFLLYRTLSGYSLDQIVASVASVPAYRLLTAGGFAAASYLCLSLFDTMAIRYAGHRLPYPRILLTSFTALSLGHNIGLAALSSGAIRYRFYARWGLRPGDVAKVIVFCGITVGLGLMILAGLALLVHPTLVQEITGLGRGAVLAVGAACLLLGAAYLGLAAVLRRPLRIRHWRVEMPGLPLALGQVVIGPLNFALVAACLHQTIAAMADLPYLSVVTAYVTANISVLVTHVPGGLGVLESVILLLLPGADIIGALVLFRVLYFLVPLCLGGLTFAAAELWWRRHPPPGRGQGQERGQG
jgi:glycosyltransferase 2 family protein